MLLVLGAFVLPLAIYSPDSESLQDVSRPRLTQRLRLRCGTLLLGFSLIALAAATFSSKTYSIDQHLGGLFALSRNGVFERNLYFQLVSCNFFHINLYHLISNLSVLMLLSMYEWRVGARRYISVFLVASIISSVIDLFLLPANTISMGSSAGICGLAAAYFLDYPEVSLKEWAVGIFCALFLIGLFSFLGTSDKGHLGGTVNWVAHLTGALAGGIYVRFSKHATSA